jgi:GT2 family glycosyltransferase
VTRLAVVTIAHGRHQHLARQQRALGASTRPPDEWVVVSMADPVLDEWGGVARDGVVPRVVRVPESPLGLPLAAARNAGAAAAIEGGAEVLVFLDVDCLPHPEALAAYESVVTERPRSIWSGPVTYLPDGLSDDQLREPWELDDPHPARPAPEPGEVVEDADPRLFWSLSFAVSASTWRDVGGFCEEYVGYGGEDTDFAMTADSRGVGLGWVGAARAYHQWHPTTSPPVHHAEDIVRNATIFHGRWGWWPMEGWLDAMAERGAVRRDGDRWVLGSAVREEASGG